MKPLGEQLRLAIKRAQRDYRRVLSAPGFNWQDPSDGTRATLIQGQIAAYREVLELLAARIRKEGEE